MPDVVSIWVLHESSPQDFSVDDMRVTTYGVIVPAPDHSSVRLIPWHRIDGMSMPTFSALERLLLT
jgi:hypothetical protein